MSKKIAIIGSGPAGCYAASALIKSNIESDVFDRLAFPYGLVRTGVAPDHSKIKKVTSLFYKTLSNPLCRFFGNVEIGKDLTVAQLQKMYSAVIFAHGAERDRKLNIEGEQLAGSFTATEFVGWYNSHPDFQDRKFNFNAKNVAIIGQGNVAVDVARILAKPVSKLEPTDISIQATKELKTSKIENIYVIGRRGPVQAAFTDKELKELGQIPNCDLIIKKEDLELSDVDKEELEKADKVKRSNFSLLEEFSKKPSKNSKKKLYLVFYKSPKEFLGNNKVEQINLELNELVGQAGEQKSRGTAQFELLDVDMVFRSIGYQGKGIEGLPFKWGKYINTAGRIEDENQKQLKGLYCAGWIKRGPSGVIGTNKACSVETVKSLIEDLDSLPEASGEISEVINKRIVTLADWEKLDKAELELGKKEGKERVKFGSNAQALGFLEGEE